MNKREILYNTLLTVLCIICFPVNPLVLLKIIEPGHFVSLYTAGWFVWGAGMVLVMAPIIIFPRRGGVAKGRSFVNTTQIVTTGIYGIVRHPQYLGGILSIFITSFLWYPHWIFGVLGAAGVVVIYLGAKEEDQRMIKKFGEEYIQYMKKVPGLNLITGLVRSIKK